MFELFIEFILSLYGWHNLVIKPRFWVDLHSDLFWWGYEIYCSYKSICKIWVNIIYTSIRSDSLGKWSLLEFPKTFQWNTFSFNKQKPQYVYGILVGMSFLCSKSGHDQKDQDLYMTLDWLTLSDEFISIWSVYWPCYYLF